MVNLTNPEMTSICEALSQERLSPYCAVTKTRSDALELYRLNLILCQLMYPSLNTFEITLRNAINQVLSEHYGQEWLTNGKFVLQDYEIEKVQASYRDLRKRNPTKNPPSQAQLIADLPLGFWTSFFRKSYDETFWRPHSKQIFPHVARKKDRNVTEIQSKLKNIQKLRNRVFHHEPIWKKHEELIYIVDDIYRLVGWINPNVVAWMKQIDKFKKIYTDDLEDQLEKVIISSD
jgi:hypothetical protein